MHALHSLNFCAVIFSDSDDLETSSKCRRLVGTMNKAMKYMTYFLKMLWFLLWYVSGCWFVSGCKQSSRDKWMTPVNMKSVVIAYIVFFILPHFDVASDTYTGVNFFLEGDFAYGSLTLGAAFLPAILKLVQALKDTFMVMIKNLELTYKDPIFFLEMLGECLYDGAKDTFTHLPFIQPFHNLKLIIELCGLTPGRTKSENVNLMMANNGGWEPFTESTLQLMVQLYILLNKPNPPGITEFVTFQTVTSCLSIAVSAGSNYMSQSIDYPIGSLTIPIKLYLGILFFPIYIPRIMNIALVVYQFNQLTRLNEMTSDLDILGSKNGWSGVFTSIILVMVLFLPTYGLSKLFRPKLPPTIALKKDRNEKEKEGNTNEVNGEYEQKTKVGYGRYMDELKYKGVLLSVVIPCIVVHRKSHFFRLTSVVSTILHIICSLLSHLVYYCWKGSLVNKALMENLPTNLSLSSISNYTWNYTNLGEENYIYDDVPQNFETLILPKVVIGFLGFLVIVFTISFGRASNKFQNNIGITGRVVFVFILWYVVYIAFHVMEYYINLNWQETVMNTIFHANSTLNTTHFTADNKTFNETSELVQFLKKDNLVEWFYFIQRILLGLSIIVCMYLSAAVNPVFFSNSVEKLSFGWFRLDHPSVIACAIEDQIKKEYAIEQELKSIAPTEWRKYVNAKLEQKKEKAF